MCIAEHKVHHTKRMYEGDDEEPKRLPLFCPLGGWRTEDDEVIRFVLLTH